MPVQSSVTEHCPSTNRGTQADMKKVFWLSFVFEEQHLSDPNTFSWPKIDLIQ